MHDTLALLYEHDCGHDHAELTAGESISKIIAQVKAAFSKAAVYVHGQKKYRPAMLKEPAIKAVITSTNKALQQAISKSITSQVPQVMREALQKNVFYFSGMKTHAAMEELSSKLMDDQGKIKPLDKFTEDAKKLNETYNDNYLRAERNFATKSAQTAAKWSKYEQGKERYDLRYLTDNGPNVRDSHRALEFTTLPVDDPFWDKYTPPNGYNCHCFLVQVRKGEYPVSDSDEAQALGDAATTQINKDGVNKAEIFRFNPGKEMKVMPPNHPYTSGDCGKLAAIWKQMDVKGKISLASRADKCQAKKVVEEMAKRTSRETIKQFENGGEIQSYPQLVDTNGADYKRVLDTAGYFAQNGDKTIILPKVNTGDAAYDLIYGQLKGTKYYGKCPDFLRNNIFYEHEGFTTKNPKRALKNMLNRGLKQSDSVVIEKCGVSHRYLKRNILARINEGQNISEVWEKDGKKLLLIYKKQKPDK